LKPEQKLIYASTISIYGESGQYFTEESKIVPNSVYGQTKWEGEKIALEAQNGVALRFSTAFGLSIQPRFGYLLLNDFVKEIVEKKQLVVFDKDFKRSFIHVRDMVDAYWFTIYSFGIMKGQAFNVGSETENYTKEQIALMIQDKYPCELFFKPGSGEDNRDYFINFDKVKALGYKTTYSVNDGINELIKGFKIYEQEN
jgi:nucleoside-diphosphate-sugar epimerase